MGTGLSIVLDRPVRALVACALFVIVIASLPLVMSRSVTPRPRWVTEPPAVAPTDLEQRFAAFVEYRHDRVLPELRDTYDQLAESMLDADPAIDAGLLERQLRELPHLDDSTRVLELRPGERLILWRGIDESIHGGGARASVLVRDAAGWRNAGHIDSTSDSSSVNVEAIDLDGGIVTLVESFDGNGWPPSQVRAIAVAAGHLITVTSEHVPAASREHSPAARQPALVVARRDGNINSYPDAPILASRWRAVRDGDRLRVVEESLTPWTDALVAFCSGVHPEVALAAVRADVHRCGHRLRSLRWRTDGELRADLPLELWCDDAEDGAYARERDDGWLTIGLVDGAWRITDSARCEDSD